MLDIMQASSFKLQHPLFTQATQRPIPRVTLDVIYTQRPSPALNLSVRDGAVHVRGRHKNCAHVPQGNVRQRHRLKHRTAPDNVLQRPIMLEILKHHLLQHGLIILARLVSRNVWLVEVNQHGTDVLVLELNGPVAAIVKQGSQCTTVGRLVDRPPSQPFAQHRKVVGDD